MRAPDPFQGLELRPPQNGEAYFASDSQVLNAMGMEGGQKVFVVLVHPVPFPNP